MDTDSGVRHRMKNSYGLAFDYVLIIFVLRDAGKELRDGLYGAMWEQFFFLSKALVDPCFDLGHC